MSVSGFQVNVAVENNHHNPHHHKVTRIHESRIAPADDVLVEAAENWQSMRGIGCVGVRGAAAVGTDARHRVQRGQWDVFRVEHINGVPTEQRKRANREAIDPAHENDDHRIPVVEQRMVLQRTHDGDVAFQGNGQQHEAAHQDLQAKFTVKPVRDSG